MKKQPRPQPTRSKLSIFRQLCNLIPSHLVSQLARDTGAEEKSRSFKPWSHVVSLLFAQFTHAVGLNDVCDALRLHSVQASVLTIDTSSSRKGITPRVEYGIEKPSNKLLAMTELDSDTWVAEVKRIRGKQHPLTAAGLHALRDEYTRAIAPARSLVCV
jgi:hypothetical protein